VALFLKGKSATNILSDFIKFGGLAQNVKTLQHQNIAGFT